MESVARSRMSVALYPALLRLAATDPAAADNVIAATADGYAFPTNLDRDQPLGGLAPQSPADLLRQAVVEAWPADGLTTALADHSRRRRTS